MRIKFLLLALLIVIFSAIGFADNPNIMSYNGRLFDSSGKAVTTTKILKFRIYDSLTSGNLLWSSSDYSVAPDSSGIFSVLLGSQNDEIEASVFNDAERYLEIVLEGTSMSPRLRLVSSPYSFRSSIAGTIIDSGITSAKLASFSVTTEKLASSCVTAEKIEDGSISALKFTSGNVVKKITA